MPASQWWYILLVGYTLSVAIEMPLLLIGLSPHHPWRRRVFAGFWLTACTYPIVAWVLPVLLYTPDSRWLYLLVAETFAPLAEMLLFHVAFRSPQDTRASQLRDAAVIVVANLASFLIGLLIW